MIRYPIDLPDPIRATMQSAERRVLSTLPGARQARALQRQRMAGQELEFVFTYAQAVAFAAWVKDDLVDGGAWFTSYWPQPQGGPGTRRFVGAPSSPVYVPTLGWHVTAQCIVLEGQDLLLLDSLTVHAAAAFSTRRLRNAYSGPCLRVRRSSDSEEQDIAFVDNRLDTAALSAFVGSSTGYVAVWYDQSGNGVNATQTDTAWQPTIVVEGVLSFGSYGRPVASYPAIYINSNNLNFVNTRGQDDVTLNSLFVTNQSNSYSAGSGYGMSGFLYSDTGGVAHDLGFGNLGNKLSIWGGQPGTGEISVQSGATINDGLMHLGVVTRATANGAVALYLDGHGETTGTGPTGTRSDSSGLQIGSAGQPAVGGSPQPAIFCTPEEIVFPSVLSAADLGTLHSNQQAAYLG